MKILTLMLIMLCSQVFAETNVFRCNLDNRTRVLVFQAGKYYAAYDTNKGSFWKYWKSDQADQGIKFEGAVYDGRHGPQPSSLGSVILEKKDQLVWSLGNNKASYTSYSPVRKNITNTIIRPDGSSIKIIETPDFNNEKLNIKYSVSGLKSGEKITLGALAISKNGQTSVEVK